MSCAPERITERAFVRAFVMAVVHAPGMKCGEQPVKGVQFIAMSFVAGTTES
jgi:hypothetical protein